jgi:hypothetical protein
MIHGCCVGESELSTGTERARPLRLRCRMIEPSVAVVYDLQLTLKATSMPRDWPCRKDW